jgi:hypothetical protein
MKIEDTLLNWRPALYVLPQTRIQATTVYFFNIHV